MRRNFHNQKKQSPAAYCGTEFSLNTATFVAEKMPMPSSISHIRNVTTKLVHKINSSPSQFTLSNVYFSLNCINFSGFSFDS